jgi:hypothetical protein
MRSRSTFLTTGVGLLFVVLMAASAGNAQEVGGKFTLPFAAIWGSTVMPPGDYTFTVLSAYGSTPCLDVKGKTVWFYIMAARKQGGTDAGRSRLTVQTIGKTHFIGELILKEGNLTFEFSPPNSAKSPAQLTGLWRILSPRHRQRSRGV